MKTTNILLTAVLCLFLGFEAASQKRGSYLAGTVFQEVDFFSTNFPVGAAVTAKLGPLFLQADYRYTLTRNTPATILAPTANYGAKIGFMGGRLSAEGISSFGFSFGFQQVDIYKKLTFDEGDYPRDVNGDFLDAEKVNIGVTGTQFSLGLTGLLVNINRTGNAESLIDDYDLAMKRDKVRYSTMLFTLEMLYMPDPQYSNTFSYTPYGYYVPREATISPDLKKRKLGVKIRFEYAPYTKIGFLMEMGLLPGIMNKTELNNDFNLGVRAGILVNLSTFSKIK